MSATCRCWCGCGRRDPELDDETSPIVECVPCLTSRHKRLPPDKTCPTCGAAWDETYRTDRRAAVAAARATAKATQP
jgi:hypothetical protein